MLKNAPEKKQILGKIESKTIRKVVCFRKCDFVEMYVFLGKQAFSTFEWLKDY